MMFFLHLAGLLYGLAAILIGKFRTSGPMWEAGNSKFYELVEQFFPESVFQPWETDVEDLHPDMSRTYLIGGALVAYCGRYLFTKHRG